MSVRPTEYGSRGVWGLGTPQANPTVEPELWLLRPPQVSLATVRLVSPSADPKVRLTDYLSQLHDSLTRFDELALDGFGFACTGSTYIYGYQAERDRVAKLQDQFGYPIVTAAAAIESALNTLGAQRIAMIAPYPSWLAELGATYWRGRGFNLQAIELARLASTDTRRIYELGSRHALEVLAALSDKAVDAVVFSGTGMPSLRAIIAAQADWGLAAVSSNLCLAWAMAEQFGAMETQRLPAQLLDINRAGIESL